MSAAIEFDHVDILFTRERGRAAERRLRSALAALDGGMAYADLAQAHGVVVGVADASLTVERSHISVLMGPPDSGKSTLLRAVNGLSPVTRGALRVQDGAETVDVTRCGGARLRRLRRGRIAMMFQQPGLLPWRNVRDNVGLGLELRGDRERVRRRIIDAKLELVGLAEWADRRIGELSGGMQQRVGLARAFATDADILLMDDPFSALDPLTRVRLQDELLMLQSRMKKTILFVTHDRNEALRLGDQISVLEAGRIVQTGVAADIVLRPADAVVAQFIQNMNPLLALDARMVMRRRDQLEHCDDRLWLDPGQRYQLALGPRGEPTRVLLDGAPLNVRAATEAGLGVAVADVATPLRDLVRLQWDTGHPVLVTEGGAFAGTCGPAEVIGALAACGGAPGQADDAN